jgi:hypothetical protein
MTTKSVLAEPVTAAGAYMLGPQPPKSVRCEATILIEKVGDGVAQIFTAELDPSTALSIQVTADKTNPTQVSASLVQRGPAADNTTQALAPIAVATPTRLVLDLAPNTGSIQGGMPNGTLGVPVTTGFDATASVLFGVTALPTSQWTVRYDDLVCWKN